MTDTASHTDLIQTPDPQEAISFDTDYAPQDQKAGMWYWDRRALPANLLTWCFWFVLTFVLIFQAPFSVMTSILPGVFVESDLSEIAVLALLFAAVFFLWQSSTRLGEFVFARRLSPADAFKHNVDGISAGAMSVRITPECLTTSMKLSHERTHLAALMNVFVGRSIRPCLRSHLVSFQGLR